MKLKDLLTVLRDNAKIYSWNTMKELGEFNVVYMEILNENMQPLLNVRDLEEKRVVVVRNHNDIITIFVK